MIYEVVVCPSINMCQLSAIDKEGLWWSLILSLTLKTMMLLRSVSIKKNQNCDTPNLDKGTSSKKLLQPIVMRTYYNSLNHCPDISPKINVNHVLMQENHQSQSSSSCWDHKCQCRLSWLPFRTSIWSGSKVLDQSALSSLEPLSQRGFKNRSILWHYSDTNGKKNKDVFQPFCLFFSPSTESKQKAGSSLVPECDCRMHCIHNSVITACALCSDRLCAYCTNTTKPLVSITTPGSTWNAWTFHESFIRSAVSVFRQSGGCNCSCVLHLFHVEDITLPRALVSLHTCFHLPFLYLITE